MIKFISNKGLINFSVLFYFTTLLMSNQFDCYFLHVLFYFSLVLCGLAGLFVNNCTLSKKKTIIILLITLTGGVNHFIIGMTSIKNIIFLILFFLTSNSLTNDALNEKTVLIAVWLNIFVVMYRFFTVGFWGNIYTNSSSNFVSVYLMYPTVIYYSIIAKKCKKFNIFPALMVWILSLLSRGRGGIISTTILIVLLYFIRYRTLHIKTRLAITTISIIAISIAMFNFEFIINKLNTSIIMEYFISRGGLKSSRIRFWSEYITQAVLNIKYFLFGVDASNIEIGLIFDFNPHNSFIEIHMCNGIFTLILVLVTLLKNGIIGIKKQNYLFFACMVSIMIRAFTDHVLWLAYGTPILFYFMFYYDNIPINSNIHYT